MPVLSQRAQGIHRRGMSLSLSKRHFHQSLVTSVSDFSKSYFLVSRSKGGHDKFVKIANTILDCFTISDWLE